MQQERQHRLPAWAKTGVVFLLYALLTIGMTWPAAANLGRAIPGSEGDALNHLWTFRWVKQALSSGHTPYFTDLMYYPDGVSLIFHNIAWVHIAAWLPLQGLFGESAAYGILFLLIFPINGLAVYLLARDVTKSAAAALVGGLVAAFWPYNLSHHNHPNLILLAWVPLAVLFVRKVRQNGRLHHTLLVALFIALIGCSRWQLLIVGGLLVGCYTLYELAQPAGIPRARFAALMLSAGVGAGLLLAPLLTPLLAAQLNRENPADLFVSESAQQSDLLAYALPHRYHPLWGEDVIDWYENVGVNKSYTPFLGYTTIFLMLLALWRRPRRAWFWGGMVLLTMLVALGSRLTINGEATIRLPLFWLQDFFLLRIVRHPDRFNVLLSVVAPVLAAWGVHALRFRKRGTVEEDDAVAARPFWGSNWVIGLVALLILVEYAAVYPVYPLDTPAWYTQLAAEPGQFGILDIPLNARSFDKEYMMYQFTHGKPLVGGHVSRLPPEAYQFIDSVPLLYALRDAPTEPPQVSGVSHQLRLLHGADVRYLVLHKKFLRSAQESAWQLWLVQPPFYEDEDVLVYKTDPAAAYAALDLVPAAGTPVGVLAVAVHPEVVAPGNWLFINVGWGSATAVSRSYERCLHLRHEGEPVWEECQLLTPDWPTTQWQAGEIVYESTAVQVDPFWPAGNYEVTGSLRTAGAASDPSPPLSLGSYTLEARQRIFDPPRPEAATAVNWHNLIHLVGYDLAHEENLALTLHWQAGARMEQSYKIFLHLINTTDGTMAAQADFVPQQWTYPTNWWEAGEFIADTVQLPLDGIAPGTYEIRLGIYNPESGERLPAAAADGTPYPDRVVPLTTITIR